MNKKFEQAKHRIIDEYEYIQNKKGIEVIDITIVTDATVTERTYLQVDKKYKMVWLRSNWVTNIANKIVEHKNSILITDLSKYIEALTQAKEEVGA